MNHSCKLCNMAKFGQSTSFGKMRHIFKKPGSFYWMVLGNVKLGPVYRKSKRINQQHNFLFFFILKVILVCF